MSYRRGALRSTDDPAYAHTCATCKVKAGRSCIHKRALLRTELISILSERSEDSRMLAVYLMTEGNLERALLSSPTYRPLLRDMRFRLLCDLYLSPVGTALLGSELVSPFDCDKHTAWCLERKADLRRYLLDSLFPPHYDIIRRIALSDDEYALESFLARWARSLHPFTLAPEVAVLSSTQPGQESTLLRLSCAYGERLLIRLREGLYLTRRWYCEKCKQTVYQNVQECCSECGAVADSALRPLPQVDTTSYPGKPELRDIAHDGVVYLERPQWSLYEDSGSALVFDDLDAACAHAVRHLLR